MSIKINGEHINFYVLKYLREMGYAHSAFLFEKEASIDVLAPECKSIMPKALPHLCEKALILKSLELHGELADSKECQADLDLVHTHSCSITEKKEDDRRRILEEINERAAVILKEDTILIPAQPKLKKKETSMQASASRAEQQQTPKPKSKVSKIPSSKPATDADKEPVSQIAERDPAVLLDNVKTDRIKLPDNMVLQDSFSDGLGEYVLLKHSPEGTAKGFLVAEIEEVGIKPLFLLPQKIISTDGQDEVKLYLEKHLIIERPDGIIHFIDYERRELRYSITNLKGGVIRKISYFPDSSCYAILSNKELIFLDSCVFDEIRRIEGSFKDYCLRIDGLCIILTTDNVLKKISLTQPEVSQNLETVEGCIESIRFSSNGLYYAAKVSNPYSLVVWDVDNSAHLLTLNENNKFNDFIFEGGYYNPETIAICYCEDYAKVYDCGGGCFLKNYDFSR